MALIQVEESALDSLKQMVEQLQSERNELLKVCVEVVKEYDNPDNGRYLRWAVDSCRDAIAKCTAKPEVMA